MIQCPYFLVIELKNWYSKLVNRLHCHPKQILFLVFKHYYLVNKHDYLVFVCTWILKITIFSFGHGIIAAKPSKKRLKIPERNEYCVIRFNRIVTLWNNIASVTRFTTKWHVADASLIPSNIFTSKRARIGTFVLRLGLNFISPVVSFKINKFALFPDWNL